MTCLLLSGQRSELKGHMKKIGGEFFWRKKNHLWLVFWTKIFSSVISTLLVNEQRIFYNCYTFNNIKWNSKIKILYKTLYNWPLMI